MNVYWLLSASFLSAISIVRVELGVADELLFVVFLTTLLCGLPGAVYFSTQRTHPPQGDVFPISRFTFAFGVFLLMLSEPIFENDHFRYLWEGKVIWSGYNPYLRAPDSISDVSFAKYSEIGFAHLTAIYPPVSMLLLAAVGGFPYKVGLICLSLLNGWMAWQLLNWLWTIRARPVFLLLTIPFFQKEFIQSVHLDLYAFFFAYLFFFRPTFTAGSQEPSMTRSLVGMFLSFYAKVIALIFVPFVLIFRRASFSQICLAAVLVLPLALAFIWIRSDASGAHAFTERWVWCPGFFSVLTRWFSAPWETARYFCLGAYGAVYTSLVITSYALRQKIEKLELLHLLTAVVAALMFFSPVVNPWYFIWLVPLAWLSGNTSGIWYAALSFLCYLPHYFPEFSWLAELLLHALFIPTIIYSLKHLVKATQPTHISESNPI